MPNNDQIVSALKKGSPKKGSPTPTKSEEILNKPSDSLQEHELDDDYHKSVKGKGEHWGYHLMMDISDCNHHIDDLKSVESFITDLVEALKMERLGKPILVKVNGQDGRGITAVQIITTSTITFHGDDDKWSAYIDVFSCKVFDPQIAVDLVEEYFEPKKMGKFWLFRDAGRWPSK